MAVWYVSLHTGDPAGGNQTTDEVAYNGYARVGSDDWDAADGNLVNGVDLVFPTNKSSAIAVTHIVVGTDATGEGSILYSGALSEPMTLYRRSTATFVATQLVVEAAAPGAVVSAVLTITRRPRVFVAYDDEQRWVGSCSADGHHAIVTATVTCIRKPQPAPLPPRVHIISAITLDAHHAEVRGVVLHDNSERLAREEEDEIIAILLMAA
jgi:hypothetical protein